MEKIYGYKEKDIMGLAKILREKNDWSLSKVFEFYGKQSKKAKGTIRNLYYALAKKSQTDKDFCNRYLDGKPINVTKIVAFSNIEEKKLLTEILTLKAKGLSVRSAILRVASGDGKLALRYQNKYRNILKNSPELIEETIRKLEKEGVDITLLKKRQNISENFRVKDLAKLKVEINSLVERIASSEKKENKLLKERIYSLEKENLKLLRLLYGENSAVFLSGVFNGNANKKIQN